MTWATGRPSNYDVAKTQVVQQPGRRPFQVCTKYKKGCKGWEWCSNLATQCRACGSQLQQPPAQRSITPKKRPQRSRPVSREASSSKESVVQGELLAMLQAQLPALQEKFPDLAKHIQGLAPQPAPAAVLHGAQNNCQIVFKELQQAEQLAADLEVEAADLVETLQLKVAELQASQSAVLAARTKYDEAAKTAQEEVQKHRPMAAAPTSAAPGTPLGAEATIEGLAKQLLPEQLEAAAIAFVAAAKSAREACLQASQPEPARPSSPSMQVEPPLFGDGGTLPPTVLPAGALPPAEVLPGGSPPGTPFENGGLAAPLFGGAAPGTPLGPLGHQGLEGAPGAPPPGGDSGGPQPGISGSGERTSSRSPRRATMSPLPRRDGNDTDDKSQSPPPSKLPKGSVHDDAHKSRGRSASSAASAGSGKSAAGLSHQHYAEIALQIKADNCLDKVPAGSTQP